MTMGSAAFDHMLEAVLLDVLSDQIVERLRARQRSALVLVSGTDLGLRPAIRSLARLSATGWRLEIRCTKDAAGLIGVDQMRELSGGEGIPAVSDAPLAPQEIEACLGRNALVLIPTLSVSLAARVALGLGDSAVPGLMLGAVERGMRVIAARDGVCPACRERAERGFANSAGYRAMTVRHLEALEAYGVELVWAAKLAEAANATRLAAAPEVKPGNPGGAKVFGVSAAQGFEGDALRLGADVVVTPLAAETLRARNVRLVRE